MLSLVCKWNKSLYAVNFTDVSFHEMGCLLASGTLVFSLNCWAYKDNSFLHVAENKKQDNKCISPAQLNDSSHALLVSIVMYYAYTLNSSKASFKELKCDCLFVQFPAFLFYVLLNSLISWLDDICKLCKELTKQSWILLWSSSLFSTSTDAAVNPPLLLTWVKLNLSVSYY